MKEFIKFAFDLGRCRKEVAAFQRFLATRKDLKEDAHIRPFFEKRRHLSAFIGVYNPNIVHLDLLAYQYPLFGDFSCDLVVGDSIDKAYSFIEFEDAGAKSLFVKQGKKVTRDWSPRFDHGYSQIIDWFCKLDDMEKTTISRHGSGLVRSASPGYSLSAGITTCKQGRKPVWIGAETTWPSTRKRSSA